MNRVEFTRIKAELITEMVHEGEQPLEDYLKRSDTEQHRLFEAGLSKCDGYKNISRHQVGKAIDIYFMDQNGDVFDADGKAIRPKIGWERWHKRWEEKGGRPMLDWDKAHFEC